MEIKKVENYSEKSFRNYTGPEEGFKQKNIIFGYNGRGKSSLAKGIIAHYNKQKNDREYRWFNKDYVKENMLLENGTDASIKGVIANFSKENVDTESKIKELQLKIIDDSKLKEEIKNLEIKIREEIDKIHNSRKGDINIVKKNSSLGVRDVIKAYNDDLSNAKKIENDNNKLIKIKGDSELEKEKTIIENLQISESLIETRANLNDIKTIMFKEYNNIEIPSSNVVKWLNEGLSLHKENDVCKFCGGFINYEHLKEKIDSYNKNEMQKASIKLASFRDEINSTINKISIIINNKNNISINLGEEVVEELKKIETCSSYLQKEKNNIEKKINNIGLESSFDDNIFKSTIETINNSIETISSIKKAKINNLNNKISKLSTLVKGAIGLEIAQNTLINNGIDEISEKENEIRDIIDNNNNIKKEIENLKSRKYYTKDFAELVSSTLESIEVNLKLDFDNGNYVLKHSKSDIVLKLEDISEGEYNLLALLFFYYELFDDKEHKKMKSSIELIVIDDPISSVDDINKMFILELMKELLEISRVQIFIFTHVWEDFCNLSYGKEKNLEYSFFEVKKGINGSELVITKTKVSPYKHAFKEIYELSKKDNSNDMTDCEIYHYPNLIRRVLEDYLSFKISNTIPTSSNIEKVLRVLCQGEPNDKDRYEVGVLINVCNILSHRISRTPDEILKSAKYLMNKIRESDIVHYNAMKE